MLLTNHILWLNCTVQRRFPATTIEDTLDIGCTEHSTRQDNCPSTWQVLFIHTQETILNMFLDQTYTQSRCDRKVRYRAYMPSRLIRSTHLSTQRYGASLRKQVKKVCAWSLLGRAMADCACDIDGSDATRTLHLHVLRQGKHLLSLFTHTFDCRMRQDSVKRTAVGIWHCRSCKKTIAGGAWTVATTAAATVRR